MSKISVVINADTREGLNKESSTVGDFGEGSLQGVRSYDFLTEGVKSKINFFRGYDVQCILYVDVHEPLTDAEVLEISQLVESYGNNSKVIFKAHDRVRHRWNDLIYLEALRLAEGDYVVHFDQDTNAFISDDGGIVGAYLELLDNGFSKFICQPTDLTLDQHKMYFASTRFFVCKRETLDFAEIERCFDYDYIFKKYGVMKEMPNPCCLEHVLGYIVGIGNVFYPPRLDNYYLIFSWVRYFSGTLKKLNEMTYPEVKEYILNLGIHGPNDVLDKKIQ